MPALMADRNAIIAAAIEECRRHAPVPTADGPYCGECIVVSMGEADSAPWPCGPWRRLSPPILAAGVPEDELSAAPVG